VIKTLPCESTIIRAHEIRADVPIEHSLLPSDLFRCSIHRQRFSTSVVNLEYQPRHIRTKTFSTFPLHSPAISHLIYGYFLAHYLRNHVNELVRFHHPTSSTCRSANTEMVLCRRDLIVQGVELEDEATDRRSTIQRCPQAIRSTAWNPHRCHAHVGVESVCKSR
jgi:hypothetical protein